MRKEIFDGRYTIDTEGNVYGPQGLKNKSINKYGYYTVGIKVINDKGIYRTVHYTNHSLVAKAFIPNPDNKPQVNHIDGDKLNNNVGNLEWATNKENMEHAFKNGLCVPLSSHQFKSGKLDFNKVKEIKELYATGNYTHKQIAEMYDVHRSNITNVLRGHSWKDEHRWIVE